VKYVVRVAPILVALAVLLGFMWTMQDGPAQGAVGVVSINDGTATTTAISYSTVGGTVTVRVVDSDLTASTQGVAVKSSSDTTGFTLSLARSTDSVNSYTASMVMGTSTNATTTNLKVVDNDTVTVTYTDATESFGTADTVTIETGVPLVAALGPTDATITKATTLVLTADLTDTVSRPDKDTIKFLFGTALGLSSASEVVPLSFTDILDGTTVTGYTATRTLGGLTDGVKYIGVQVTDKAGNQTISDADADTAGNQGNKVTIDTAAPALGAVTTGSYWDTTSQTRKADKRTSIEVRFTDALTKLDATSISTADFTVSDNTVTSADIYTSVTGISPDVQLSVFLTVGTELAPDATPTVYIGGDGVKDQAGNALTSGSAKAVDAIAPAITVVSITPTLAEKNDKVEIEVSTDEALTAAPTALINLIPATSTLQTITASLIGTNSWRFTTSKINTTGVYNIYISGADKAANSGTVGLSANADPGASKIQKFEGDVDIPDPTVTPLAASSPTTRDPFPIVVDYTAEGTEYTKDTATTVTITKFELDGVDVSADVKTADNKKFLLSVAGIALGEHEVEVNAKDAANNTRSSDFSFKFTVSARSAIKINLEPGWNLVSLPGDPSDTAINTVFADLADVTSVVSYDPALPGGFLSAVRDTDDNLAGTLETVDSNRGYWVHTNAFVTLSVDVPPIASGAQLLLPAIPVVAGWNLVPVIDLSGTLAAGGTVNAATYFASLAKITRVYTFDTASNAWTLVDHDGTATASDATDDNVTVGKAYWVYTTAAGSLVP
jgi:hypothetical protein